MAILFDWYELPEPKDKQREEKILHPRIRLNGSTSTAELRRRIQERCSLTKTDVSAVLDALSHVMGEDLAEGRQVHLGGRKRPSGRYRLFLSRTDEHGAGDRCDQTQNHQD